MLRATSVLQNCSIQAVDGKIGSVSDLLIDAGIWKVRWLVVDTGGWMTGDKVLIHPKALGEPDGSLDRLYVEMTKEQISKSPGILKDLPVSQQMDERYYGYDGWDGFGSFQSYAGGAMEYPIMLPPPFGGGGATDTSGPVRSVEPGDPNLRSAGALVGYHIRATDGEIGYLAEFLVDDEGWAVCFLIIVTRNWLPGRHVMLAPSAVVEIDWADREIFLNVTCDQVRNSPQAWQAGGPARQ
jgi:hypothetical protein